MSRENSLVEAVSRYLAGQPDVTAAYVFGSVARGRHRPDSDLDVAVLFAPGTGDKLARFDRRLELEIALEKIVRRPVQVVDLAAAPLFLQHQVRKYGRLVVDKDRARRISFEVGSRRRYFDMQRVYRRRAAALYRKLGI
ncbi:MAG: type VII toxin-antitoxin system MntA family adenylyltransferase antitoxin [Desulfotomaculales bacterium]